MDPFTLLMIGSTALSAGGQLMAGKAEKDAAKLNAFNMESEKILNRASAIQQATARKEEYDLATSANIANFSITRDVGSDMSVKAFLERQKEIVGKDISRMEQQANFERLASNYAQANERIRGSQAMRASIFSAIGTVAEGGLKYYQVMTGQD